MKEWWAYWETNAFGQPPVFGGWMFLSAFTAQHVQARIRLGLGDQHGETVHLVSAATGKVVESLVFI